MKNKLEVKGVSKVYGNVKVLSDITFVLENGIYGLIGPNGA
jgi:ABC-type branched-chain amino acid transport systems, ATPase component